MRYNSLPAWPLIWLISGLAGLFIIGLFILLLLKLRNIRRHLSQQVVVLELKPPPSPHNTQKATEEFFAVLSQVVSLRSWRDMINGWRATTSLEVVSNLENGIRFIVRLPRHDLSIFLHNLSALAPTVTAEETEDYMPTPADLAGAQIMVLELSGKSEYPLKHTSSADSPDPIAYLTNAISQLVDGELIAVQFVLTPASDWRGQTAAPPSPETLPGDIVAATLHKMRQPKFQTSIRIVVRAETEHAKQRLKGVRSALAAYSYEGYQSLQPRPLLPGWFKRYQLYAFAKRLPALFSRHALLLASSELAVLYHFPYGTANHTEDLRVGRSVSLPMPLEVKRQVGIDLLLGANHYRGRVTPIGLTANERQRHIYMIGGTGNGKSTLLHSAIVQDMRSGKGVAVIDPHGDLAESLLNYVPEARIDDVIYFNPADMDYPVGLNLLELEPRLGKDELLQAKDLVTESIVSMFRKIFSTNDTVGHRIEYVLRNAVQTALTTTNPTLFTVYSLLNDAAYRKKIVAGLDNQDLKLFWREFNRAGTFQQVSLAVGITAKIGRFLFSATARQILEQPKSSINFDEILNDGKILICNVSKGQLGEDTSELFGIMLLTKLQLATMRRARIEASKRTPFYVYIDEFQNFATPSFAQLLSEARKYQLFLTMAEQSTSQQIDHRMTDIVLANVGTIVAFRTSSQLDEQLIQPLLSPYVEEGTLSRLPAYNFYIRIAAEQSQPPFSGQTVPMKPPKDEMLGRMVIQASRFKYSRQKPKKSKAANRKLKPKKSQPLMTVDQLSEGAT